MTDRRHQQASFGRRRLLRYAFAGLGAAGGVISTAKVWGSGVPAPYNGRLLVMLQLDGGADVTQLCDPKVNVKGEPPINHWSDFADPGQVGNLQYAPVANNAHLFERFGRHTMVINGVDSQTNSHETGKLYNWTGSNAEGKPSLSALFAAAQSPNQPLAYCVYNGFSRTAGVIGYNRFDDLSNMGALVRPNIEPWSGERKRTDADLQRSAAVVQAEVDRMLHQPQLSIRQRQSLVRFTEARESRDGLTRLAELIPSQDQIIQGEDINVAGMNFFSNLKQQMQGALLVFKSGLGAAADLSLGGFDSHEEHDPVSESLLTHLAEALDFFWDYAEELGLADRILLVVGTDFGRTNFYNDGNGKDHWPIGSYMLMEQGAPWGDRVVGLTDELHFAKPLDPETLKADPAGIIMTPSHVHKAIREYLDLEGFAEANGFGLGKIKSLPLFDPFTG